ncbi:hypothetical protein ACHQM5_023051 [Ranunculus cassubicifolius]
MALKFLNKKGWHTGSLRNIENVWKAEQKHNQEQVKLEELRKQIAEEREKAEFRLLQEQAGLVPRQERLDFLYDSGLACGKGSSDGFKALEQVPKVEPEVVPSSSSSAKPQSVTPGALFEDKPQSANDTWRKLHSDPLLLIRQREQDALARIKNNPVQMANIRKSVEEKKKKHKEKSEKKKGHKKHSHKHVNDQSSEENDESKRETGKKSHSRSRDTHDQYSSDDRSESETELRKRRDEKYSSSKGQGSERHVGGKEEERSRRSHHHNNSEKLDQHSDVRSDSETRGKRRNRYDKYSSSKDQGSKRYVSSRDEERSRRTGRDNYDKRGRYSSDERSDSENEEKRDRRHERYSSSKGHGSEKYSTRNDGERNERSHHHSDKKLKAYSSNGRSNSDVEDDRTRAHEKSTDERHSPKLMEAPSKNIERPHQKQRRVVPKLSEEEKAAKLKEMQMDAVLHEEQRWSRLKKASESEAREASLATSSRGPNFLNAAQKSVYGAEKGGSSTIEESLRRRKYYSQGRSEATEGNAFRR